MADEQVMETRGRCQCGAIRYAFDGKPKWIMHCHCADCRRAVSSMLATYIGVRVDQFRYLEGEPAIYDSSPGVKRYFCPKCGTPMAYAGERWPGEVHLFHGTLGGSRAVAADGARLRHRAGSLVRGGRPPAALRENGWPRRRARRAGPPHPHRQIRSLIAVGRRVIDLSRK